MTGRRPFLCSLGIHTARRSQGDVGFCLRGCGHLRAVVSNGRTWTRYVEPPSAERARPVGLPPRSNPEPASWTCPHGTTYSGSSDFVSGARNAHDEMACRPAAVGATP